MEKITLKKQILITELKSLVAEERKVTTRILHLLQKVETGRIYAELGYSSLFDFTVRELGYSSDAAYRRISAMRLLNHLPEAEEKLASGALSLTAASELQRFFRAESKTAPKTQVDEGAIYFCAQRNGATKSRDEKITLMESLEGKTTREVSRVLFQNASEKAKQMLLSPKEKQVSEHLTQVTFTVDEEMRQKMQKLLALLSNKNKSGNYAGLIELLVDDGIEKYDPIRIEFRKEKQKLKQNIKQVAQQGRGKDTEPRASKSPTSQSISKNPRFIPSLLKRKIFIRDQGRCQYPDCNTTHYLTYDHIFPVSWGGESEAGNLQLLCSAHNRLKADSVLLQHQFKTDPKAGAVTTNLQIWNQCLSWNGPLTFQNVLSVEVESSYL